MFLTANSISIFHGTALDTTLLIDHLGSYIFHGPEAPSIDQHLVLGVSLGGHAAWQVLFNEPRVTAAVVIIGCPDYMRKFLISCFTTELHCCPNLL
jgi:pimeloyl-ACP methyl ester carboxylesterase